MLNILGISGSLRKASLNTALLRAMQACAPAGCILEVALLSDIPLYNQDDEDTKGIPSAVTQLKEKIKKADGIIISTPEYNHSIPGVLKNALDWLTRPPEEIKAIFHHRKLGLIGASPSRLGTAFAQTAWLPVLAYLNVDTYCGKQIFVGSAHTLFNAQGELVDAELKILVQDYMKEFIDFMQ